MHFLGNVRRLLISIHALLAESDLVYGQAHIWTVGFLSTLSLRRATAIVLILAATQRIFLSTLSLRRATILTGGLLRIPAISIHALLAESDHATDLARLLTCQFLSTLSLRRATDEYEEGCAGFADFYPRSPCGERHFATT